MENETEEVISMSTKKILEVVVVALTVLLTALQSIVGTGETK